MRIVTAEQMKQIETNALSYSLSYERMMENAGSAAAALICQAGPVEGRCVTLFCGKGNNGGDGFVAARRLKEAGADVAVILTDGMPRTEQARAMYALLQQMDMEIREYEADPQFLTQRLAQTQILVDAIYGTGFHGTLDEKHQDICKLMNGLGVDLYALDLPSGVDTDTGAADPHAIRATFTVVFDSDKPATVLPAAAQYCGEVLLADIGIPEQAHQDIQQKYHLVTGEAVFERLRPRPRESHKGTFGKLLIIGGCQRFMGAVSLASLAAMRSGVGYVTLASTKEVCRTVFPLIPEAVMLPLKQTSEGAISYDAMEPLKEALERATAVLIGNGLGTGEDACRIVYEVLQTAQCPVVVDADGLNVLSRRIDILQEAKAPVALTPHLMEFSRLTTLPVEQLAQDPLRMGLAFAEEHQVTLVLKGAYTNTITPQGQVCINTTGNAGLAKAGSGDVLAGIIGALAAQGHPIQDACACGVWLHGLAGDYAAQDLSQYGMLPRDVIDGLAKVFVDHGR